LQPAKTPAMDAALADSFAEAGPLLEPADPVGGPGGPRPPKGWRLLACVAAGGLLAVSGWRLSRPAASTRSLGSATALAAQLALRAASSTPAANISASAIIDKVFAKHGVGSEGGGYLADNQIGYQSKSVANETWYLCSKVDWHKVAHQTKHLDDEDVQNQLRSLHVQKYCDPKTGKAKEDATCKAIFAALEARLELNRRFPSGPKMMNYMKSDWFKGLEGHFPTWGTAPDEDDVPANTASGLCDIVRVVLNQGNTQSGSETCGPTAILASLITQEPAQAIKMAMKLMWEGKIPGLPEPCPYIYDQAPGMIPLKKKDCSSNPTADCLASSNNNFPMGLQAAFTQVATSSSIKKINEDYYKPSEVCEHDNDLVVECPADDCKWNAQANPPVYDCKVCGADSKGRVAAWDHLTSGAQIKYMCDYILGSGPGSCKYLFDDTAKKCGTFDADSCSKVAQLEGVTSNDLTTFLEPRFNELQGVTSMTPYHVKASLPAGEKRSAMFLDLLSGHEEYAMGLLNPGLPADVQDQICGSSHAVLFVASDTLKDAAKERREGTFAAAKTQADCAARPCAHWIIVQKGGCNKKEGTVDLWSYGAKYVMPMAWMQSCTCGAVTV